MWRVRRADADRVVETRWRQAHVILDEKNMNHAIVLIPFGAGDQTFDQPLRIQLAEAAQGGEVKGPRPGHDRGHQTLAQPVLQLGHEARIRDIAVYIQYQRGGSQNGGWNGRWRGDSRGMGCFCQCQP